jgi:hypothetical protein
MIKKISILALILAVSVILTPLAFAKPWDYPKNNTAFEEYGVIYDLNWGAFIGDEYAATAGLEDPNKLVITHDEIMVVHEIRIGEDGPGQRVYYLGEDFTYTGKITFTIFDPILPYAFDPSDIYGTLFVAGRMHHFRVDYMYDFGDGDGGLDGTLTMLALITGNDLMLGERPMWITSLQGTGDFQNVKIKATTGGIGHTGIVKGWPE